MSGFKTLSNANPTTRRPLRIADLQDLWDGIADIFSGLENGIPYIVTGFDIMEDGVTLDSGVIYMDGKLYKYTRSDSDTLTLGATVWLADSVNAETRIFGDGTQQVFSYENVATSVETPNSFADFVMTDDIVRFRKIFGIPDGSVTTSKLADNSVTYAKIANDSVSFAQQVTGSHSLAKGLEPAANPLPLPYKNTFRTWDISGSDETNPTALFTLNQNPTLELAGKVLKHEILINNLSGVDKTMLISVTNQGVPVTYLVTVGNAQSKIVSVYVSCGISVGGNLTATVHIGE